MSLIADNVRVGVTGAVYMAETSATEPTSATSTLTGFTDLGYVGPDGVEENRDRSTSQIRAWQNSDLVREIVTEATATFTFMLMETNEAVLEAYYGALIDPLDGSIEVNPAATGGKKSFVIDVIDGDSQIRTYVPSGEILAVEAQTAANGDAVMYGVTITAYASEDGYTFKKFYSDLVGS
jgi:hypothetical protein